MKKSKTATIEVRGTVVSILTGKEGDYISLTDMFRAKDGEFFISDWLRNRNTVEFLGIWESVFNPGFNYSEFAIIRIQAGLNSYKMSVKATAGRYGGTFFHPDTAFKSGENANSHMRERCCSALFGNLLTPAQDGGIKRA